LRSKLKIKRSSIYRFLSLLYSKEPDNKLLRKIKSLDFIQALSELGIEFQRDFLERPEQEILDEMIQEYTRLFIGPGRHISPHESVHREGEGLLWGDSTARVKRFIESSGLKYRSDFKGIPDHISVELEFMYRLVEAEEEAREENDSVKLKKILNMERGFVNEHILKWIPQFSDMVVKEARTSFYRKMAELTKRYILFEAENFGK
jgi:TorA maturation chaperone TorD